MENIFGIILSSTVLVSLINFYQWNQNKRLERITDKREEWREKLRELFLEILKSNEDTENEELSKLKVLINTKGLMLTFDKLKTTQEEDCYFSQDGYIWEIIRKIEQAKDDNQKKMLKQHLIVAISLLIKHDWDRSKNEITSNEIKMANYTTCIFMILSCILFVFLLIEAKLDPICAMFSLAVFIFQALLIPTVLLFVDLGYHKHQAKKLNEEGIFGKIINIRSPISFFTSLCVMIGVYGFYFYNYHNLFGENIIPTIVVLVIISMFILISHQNSLQVYSTSRLFTYYKVAEHIMNDINGTKQENQINS